MNARLAPRGQDGDLDEAASGLSSEQLLDALRRTKAWILLFALIGLAAGGFAAVVTPNSYLSVAKLMVRWGSREQTATDAVDAPPRAMASSRAEDIQTEIQLLVTPVVFERTVKALGAAAILDAADPAAKDDDETFAPIRWFHAAQQWWFDRSVDSGKPGCCTDRTCPRCVDVAIRTLQTRVSIASEPGTSLIDINGLAPRPEAARKLVAALLAQIEARHREVFAIDPAYKFLLDQMNDAKEQRDNAAVRLADSRQQCRVYDLAAQRNALLKEKEDLDALTRSQQTELRTIGAQLSLFARWVVAAKEKKPETIQVQVPNPTYDLRLRHVETLRSEREALLATHVPDSPEVADKDRQIAFATETLEATPMFVMQDSASGTAAQITRLQGEIEALMARQKGTEAAAEATAAHVRDVEDALEKLGQCEPDLKRLEKDLEVKTAAAARFTEAFDRYAVTKALDEARMSNLRTIQEPTLPLEKFGPNRRMFVLLGLVLGGGAGLILAFLSAAFDRKLRGPSDLERQLGVRVLCTIPETARLRRAVP